MALCHTARASPSDPNQAAVAILAQSAGQAPQAARIGDQAITRINELLPWNLQALPCEHLTENEATLAIPAQA
jgi:hypothetical protein